MRRFAFHLAGLEKLLVQREDSAELRAAQAAAERQRAEGLLAHLEQRRAAAQRERHERRAERAMGPHEEALYERYFERLGRTIGQQRQAAARAAEQHAVRLGELRSAATRRRAIGLLHERRLAGHDREAQREMTRTLDEVGSRRHGRGGPSAGPTP